MRLTFLSWFWLLGGFSPLSAQQESAGVSVLDLNDIDLEQSEENWQNVPPSQATDVTKSVTIEEIIEPTMEYRYSPFGKADPFLRPNLRQTIAEGNSNDPNAKPSSGTEIPMVSPLQGYPLDDLEIKGVWVLQNGSARAVVMTPKKEGIVVKEGDPIAAGKILSIARQRMVVRQYRIRDDGVREFEDTELPIGLSKDTDRGVIKFAPGKKPEFVRFGEEGQGGDGEQADNANSNAGGGEGQAEAKEVPLGKPASTLE